MIANSGYGKIPWDNAGNRVGGIHADFNSYSIINSYGEKNLQPTISFSPKWLDLVSFTVVWLNWCICFIINSILKLPDKSNYPKRYKVMNLCHAQRNCISGFKKRFHWIFFIPIAFLFFLLVCGFCVWFYFVYLIVCLFFRGRELVGKSYKFYLK